jgi:general secretion pathway protein F
MPAYRYTALDAQGRELGGQVAADNERSARQALRERGLLPTTLVAGVDETGATGGQGARWPRSQRVLMIRQLATLLKAGMPLEMALSSIGEQTDDAATRQRVRQLRSDVSSGMPLSSAMAAQAPAFGTMDCALVRVAETTGRLDTVLEDLAQHLEAGDAFRQRITVALVYPSAILVIALFVVGALLVYVVPQIVEVFARQKQALPLLTRMLIALSELLRAIWLPAFVAALVGAWPVSRLLSRPAVREHLVAFAGRLPVAGRLLRIAGTQRFAATLGMALKGGVPLVPALGLTRAVLALPAQRQAVDAMVEAVSRGAALGATLQGERGVAFEPSLRHFVVLGEQNGELAAMLDQVGRQQRAALEYRLGWLTGLLEPALVVGMGLFVLLIVLAILLPIIEVNQFLR